MKENQEDIPSVSDEDMPEENGGTTQDSTQSDTGIASDHNEEVIADKVHSEYQIPDVKDSVVRHHLPGMFQNWFLDYASYVILERAVPHIQDGLKPVQRRILQIGRASCRERV